MASKSLVKLRGLITVGVKSTNGFLNKPLKMNTRGLHHLCRRFSGFQHQTLYRSSALKHLRFCTVANSSEKDIRVKYENGLPQLHVPLPSRPGVCQFTLRPISNTLGDFITALQNEDHGIDLVIAYAEDGTRIAKSTTVDILLQSNFDLVINDERFSVKPPKLARTSHETATDLSDIKSTISQLYSTLNIEEHQLQREKELLGRLENLKVQLQPYDAVKCEIDLKAVKRTNMLSWVGLGMMGLQFGVLARLTWWEYSWDIMEPVTYFVTYGTAIAMAAYYVLTKQEYNFKEVRDREFLLTLHRAAKKKDFNIDHYNRLMDAVAETEQDLQRLRDPLQLQLPTPQITTPKLK